MCSKPRPSDIEFAQGRFVIAGTDRAIGIMELAEKLRGGINLPEGVPQSLDVKHVSDGPERRRPSRTAATSARSRSIPTPA